MKKIVIGLAALVVVAIGVFIFLNSNKNELEINITAPVDASTDKYAESLIIFLGEKEHSDEVYAGTTEIMDRFYQNQAEFIPTLGEPFHIEVEVRFEDGKTIISNIGTYTDENGNTQDYEDELIFDFIVTEKVTYPE